MRSFLMVGVLLVTITGTASSGLSVAADSPCSTPNDGSATLLASYKWLATATDTSNVARRQAMGLSSIAASEVSLVADTAVCRTAVNAINNALLPESATTTEVHVLRFGATRYVVFDEFRTAGEWIYRVIFNASFSQVFNIGRD